MKLLLNTKRNLFLLLTIVFICFTSLSYAVNVPRLTDRVVDNANMLTSTARRAINNKIIYLEKNTSGQMAVLTMKTLEGDSLEDFGIRTAKKWKIGRAGKDNGLILIIIKNSSKIRLEVGYGWEGVINDARAGDIIRAMKPYFKRGDYEKGILKALSYAGAYITGNKAAQPSQKSIGKGSQILIWILSFLFVGGMNVVKRRSGRTYRGRGYGFWGGFGGGGSGGGFSGGGGNFGGGGASGGW